MKAFVVQVRVEAVDRNGKAVFRDAIPVPLSPLLKDRKVIDVKKSLRKLLGVPLGDQVLLGPLPSKKPLDNSMSLVEARVIPGLRSDSHSKVSAGELFTTVAVSVARNRIQLASDSYTSSSDMLILETRHPLREYLLSDGFYYQRFKNPAVRILVYGLFYLFATALALAAVYWLWQVGRFSLPKPKVWLNIEKKVIKFMMLQDLDEDIPPEIREQLEKLEL